jgi:putative intracellular protease/amidase
MTDSSKVAGSNSGSTAASPSASGENPRRQLSVGFVLLPHFTLVAFSTIVDLLRLAADEGDRSRPEHCSWSILAPDLAPISASCGLQVMPWETFDRPERFDYLVGVGGLINRHSTYHSKTLEFLRAAAAKGVSLAGICTGSFALIEAGLMRGRKCCVSWYHLPDLIERYGDVEPVADRLFVEDGKFITCAGGLAASRSSRAACGCSTVFGCSPIQTRPSPWWRPRAASPTSLISTGTSARRSAAPPRRCAGKGLTQ